MTLPTENGHAAPWILAVCQNLVSFPVLRHIEPQAPLLGGASVDILPNMGKHRMPPHWSFDPILSASDGTGEKREDKWGMDGHRSNNKRQRRD